MKPGAASASLVACAVAVCATGCSGSPAPREAVGSSASADSTECNAGPYVDGVDVYDGTGTIDFKELKASGVDFAIIKATQGNYDTQKTFATNWAGAKAAGVARSAYHFFDPTVDGTTQATYFLGVMGTLEPGDLPPTLDIECPDGQSDCLGFSGGSGDETGSVITSRMNDWLSAVEAATGVKPLVYSFEDYFAGAGIDTTGLSAFPLYIAYPTTKTCFGIPSPWSSAVIWQNSDTGKVGGVSGEVDTDRFLGTMAQLQALEVGGFAPPSAPNGNRALSVANLADGQVEVFAETSAGSAAFVSTTGTGDAWATAVPLSGAATCGLASVAWPPASGLSVSVFDGTAAAGTQETTLTSGVFGPFAPFGGDALSELSTLAFQDGHVEVFALGASGQIWHDVYSLGDKGWSGWSSLGGSKMTTGAGPILWGDGHAEIFAVDASGVPWHDTTASATSSTWQGWSALTGGVLASRPVPARWADGHVQVFARGADDNLYGSDNTGGTWPAFTVINEGTAIAGDLSVVVYPLYGPEVFTRSPKGELLHAWTEGTKLVAWASDFDEVLSSDPLAWLRPDGDAEVFGVDTKGDLVKSLHDGSTWSSFAAIAKGISACDSGSSPPPPPPAIDAGVDGGRSVEDSGTTVAPEAGATKTPATSPSASGGCGCRVAPGEARGGLALGALVGLALVRRGRRRRGG